MSRPAAQPASRRPFRPGALSLTAAVALVLTVAVQAPALAAFVAGGAAQTSVSTATLSAPATVTLTTTRCQPNGRWSGTAAWPQAALATDYAVTLLVDGSPAGSETTASTSEEVSVSKPSGPTRTFSVQVQSKRGGWTSTTRTSGTVSC